MPNSQRAKPGRHLNWRLNKLRGGGDTGESRSRPKAALSDNAGESVQNLSYCLQVSQSLNHIALAGVELSVWFSLKKPAACSLVSLQN